MITNESIKKQSLFKWILVVLTGEKKVHNVPVHIASKKSDCDGAELFFLVKSHVTFFFIMKIVSTKTYLFAEVF